MALPNYKEKQSFKENPEPTCGKADWDNFRFVIQNQDASHLHYDFRLEMEEVLIKGYRFNLKTRMFVNPAMNSGKEEGYG